MLNEWATSAKLSHDIFSDQTTNRGRGSSAIPAMSKYLGSRMSLTARCVAGLKMMVPAPGKAWIRQRLDRYRLRPPVGWVRFGTFNRLTPICPIFGLERGQGIDRYYIEAFLQRHRSDIRNHV